MAAMLALGVDPIRAQTITNPSFEANSFSVASGLISDNTAITGWIANVSEAAGLNPAGGVSTYANNGAIPDGANVAFINAGFTSLSTTLEGLTIGKTYRVTFRANAPTNQAPNLLVNIGGGPVFPPDAPITVYPVGVGSPYTYLAFEFTASEASQVMEVVNQSGTDTVLVDAFSIAQSSGAWSLDAWSDDASSGVDPAYVYTHAYNFGNGPTTTINSVAFTGVSTGNPSVANSFSTTFLGNTFNGDGNNVTGSSRALANDFLYGGTVPAGSYQSISLAGLTPGTDYVLTIFTVGWEPPTSASRWATFSMGEDRLTVNQDLFGDNGGLRISCRYKADANGNATLRIAPVNPSNVSIHIYGFCNREAVSRNVKPTINEQPRGSTIAAGVPITLRSAASGFPNPTYQWRRNGNNIQGATEATYAIASAAADDAGTYDVVVSNVMGSVTSNPARLVVGLAMKNSSFEADLFTVFPGYVDGNGAITDWSSLGNHGLNPANGSPFADNGAIPHGSQVAFMQGDGAISQTVPGFVVGKDYYLHYYENSRTGNAPSLEARLGSQTIVPPHSVPLVGGSNPYHEVFSDVFTAASAEAELSIIKSNPLGGDTTALIDNVAVVEVPAGTIPFAVRSPASIVVSVGESATFSVQAIGSTPLTYQWLKNGSPISGATGVTYSLSNIQKTEEADYAVTISNGAGNSTTAAAHLTVFETIPDLYNTGLNDGHGALADGAVDTHYVLLQNPDTGSPDAIVEDSTAFPIVTGPWLANTASSKWIGPRLNTAASAIGLFTYRTTFKIVDRDPTTVIIHGRWATDNSGRDIKVNGVSIGAAQSGSFAAYTSFVIDSSNATFVQGVNTIDFVVENEAAVGYTGLRVDIVRSNLKVPTGTAPHITAQPQGKSVPEGETVVLVAAAEGTSPLNYQWLKNGSPINGQTGLTLTLANVTTADAGTYTFKATNPFGVATSDPAVVAVPYRLLPVAFGTGVAADGTLLAGGSVDPHYTLTASADDGFPGPDAMVLNDAWPVGPAWLAHGPKSKWISVQADQSVGNAEGNYTYRTTVDLTGLDPAAIHLEGAWAADNAGVDILLNGTSLGLTSPGFSSLVPFAITGGLIAGVNNIDFIINNGTPTPNPVGLRVDLRALVSVVAPAHPKLSVRVSGGNVSVSWTPVLETNELQWAPNVTGPWTTITNPGNPYTAPAGEARRFYRVIE